MVNGLRGKGLGKEIFETIGDWLMGEEQCVEIEELAKEKTMEAEASHFFLGGAEGQSLGK